MYVTVIIRTVNEVASLLSYLEASIWQYREGRTRSWQSRFPVTMTRSKTFESINIHHTILTNLIIYSDRLVRQMRFLNGNNFIGYLGNIIRLSLQSNYSCYKHRRQSLLANRNEIFEHSEFWVVFLRKVHNVHSCSCHHSVKRTGELTIAPDIAWTKLSYEKTGDPISDRLITFDLCWEKHNCCQTFRLAFA